MTKLPLFLKGALVDGGRLMTKAEALALVRAAHGNSADVAQTEGNEGGTHSKQWRAIY